MSEREPAKKRSKGENQDGARREHSSVIKDPAPGDVILGRGSANAWRPGNSHLHHLVDHYQTQYHEARSRKAKANVVDVIYKNMKDSGRFLRKIPGREEYEEVMEKTVREKIAHTLRDRRPKVAPQDSHVHHRLPRRRLDSSPDGQSEVGATVAQAHHGSDAPSFSASASGNSESFLSPMLQQPPNLQGLCPVVQASQNRVISSSYQAPVLNATQQVYPSVPVRNQDSHARESGPSAEVGAVEAAAEQKNGTVSSPSSAESSDLFSDKDLKSVLGRPDEYR